MEIKYCFLRLSAFFFKYKAAYSFALVISDCEIDALDEVTMNEFLFRANWVDVVRIFGGCNDAFPGALEVDLQSFHK